MSNLVSFAGAGLPAVASLSTALRTISPDTANLGVTILKMDRTGHWVYGADQTEADVEATWAVNPFSFIHGYIAWGDGEVLGEKMVPVTQPLPELDAAPPGAKKGWETQVGMSLKALSGDDAGLDARYTVTSVGGKKAVQALALAVAAQVEVDQEKPVAIVRLKRESYQHKSYGRIFTPVFEIVGWMGLNGEGAPEAAADAADAEPARRRRST